jgi:hypothetical protein
MDLKGNTLLLYQFVEKHGKVLHELIKNTLDEESRPVFFIHGNVDADEREEVRRLTETESNAIIVAVYSLLMPSNVRPTCIHSYQRCSTAAAGCSGGACRTRLASRTPSPSSPYFRQRPCSPTSIRLTPR